MPDLRQQLRYIRDEAVEFFAHISATAQHGSDLWKSLAPEDRDRQEVIREKLGQLMARVSFVFRETPTLGGDALRTLHRGVRRMDSALRFKQWEGWEASTQYHEDHAIGVTPAGESENLVSATTAQWIFEDAIGSILALLSFAVIPDSTEASTDLEQTGALSQPKGRAKGRSKRGPKPDYETASRVGEIVARVAPDGEWRGKLDDVCEALDEAQIPFPPRWRKRDRSCNGWASYDERANAVKAIEYRLGIAEQRKRTTPETLS